MSSSPMVTKRLKKYEYFAPATLSEAVSLLVHYDGKAIVLAGGTDILPMMKLRVLTPKCIVNLKRIDGLDYIREEEREIKIGALTTIAEIMASDLIKLKCRSLFEAATVFATPQVRNMATIGGNICRSSPCADTVTPLISFDAELKLVGVKGERKVVLEEIFGGAGKNVIDREILTEIVVPLPREKCGAAFAKLTRNSADLAKINCAIKITMIGQHCEDIRIVFGAVADRPVRVKKAEIAIRGKDIKDGVFEEAARRAVEDIAPITDVRSTAEYRKQVSQVLVKRLMKVAFDRSAG